jgi:hypothetical protein
VPEVGSREWDAERGANDGHEVPIHYCMVRGGEQLERIQGLHNTPRTGHQTGSLVL